MSNSPYQTHRERDPDRQAGPCPGLCVTTPTGRYFFAGGSIELAMAWARPTLGAVLDEPTTRIEYGTAAGSQWACEKVVKAPPERPDRPDRRERP